MQTARTCLAKVELRADPLYNDTPLPQTGQASLGLSPAGDVHLGGKTSSTGEVRRDTDPRRPLGRRGEDLAVAHMQRLGFSVVARNQRTRYGEIDLVVFDGSTLVFVEVKTRRASNSREELWGNQLPLTWLCRRQRSRLRLLARAWLSEQSRTRPRAQNMRFDAVGVVLNDLDELVSLDHIEEAW
jgi:putative endonuclease